MNDPVLRQAMLKRLVEQLDEGIPFGMIRDSYPNEDLAK